MIRFVYKGFCSHHVRRLRTLINNKQQRVEDIDQELRLSQSQSRQLNEEQNQVKNRYFMYGEMKLMVGSEQVIKNKPVLETFSIGDREDDLKINPQINMTDEDYDYQILDQYFGDIEHQEHENDQEINQKIQQNQTLFINFITQRQSIFGKLELEGLSEQEKKEEIQRKLNYIMKYSEKDFNKVLKEKQK